MSEEERDMQAAEFALGILSGEERTHIQSARRTDKSLDAAISTWERILAPLISAGPVPPSDALWSRIGAQL